jgi:hypothetical protein
MSIAMLSRTAASYPLTAPLSATLRARRFTPHAGGLLLVGRGHQLLRAQIALPTGASPSSQRVARISIAVS